MGKIKVYVDGQEGTTGLEIDARLSGRTDIELLKISPELRKDASERERLIRSADICFICLPDEAARESAAMARGSAVRLIDASTAHRTDPDWAYGLPELEPGQREKIASASRVSVPGCHATAFILAVAPLVRLGIARPDYPFSATSISGYSGAGKKLIAVYEDPGRKESLRAPRPYALALRHKHLPEMKARAGLAAPPAFMPMVGDYYRGMVVSVPLLSRLLVKPSSAAELSEVYSQAYAGEEFLRVLGSGDPSILDEGFLDPMGCNGTNRADIAVFGHEEQSLVCVRIDNLGKGASGAAVQCMNIMCGFPESAGLIP
jgi:N-acetyl-gamma-glutamyl-phosphate reductase